jgi:hypothetical protein
MKGRQLIPVAEKLARGHPPQEPFARSAVSRAYYAAFGELSDYLRARFYSKVESRNSHDAAWNHLKNGIPDTDIARRAQRQAVADAGFRLKSRRQKADYRLSSHLGRDEAQAAISEAKRIVTELEALDAANP